MIGHRLVLIDRGEEHQHRWDATCICGWKARHARRKHVAKGMYRMHIEGLTTARKRRSPMKPRRLTGREDLPESLQ